MIKKKDLISRLESIVADLKKKSNDADHKAYVHEGTALAARYYGESSAYSEAAKSVKALLQEVVNG